MKELLAYHRWLLQVCGRDRTEIAGRIFRDCWVERNPMAFNLLEATGDEDYTQETFLKAADLIINNE